MREQPIFETCKHHHRKLETFGGVQRHHLHAVFPRLGLSLAGLEHGMRQKRLERRQIFAVDALGFEAPGCGHEFEQVLGPRFAALGFFFAVMLEQATGVQHLIDDLVEREFAGVDGEAFDELQEALNGRGRLGAECCARGTGRGGAP